MNRCTITPLLRWALGIDAAGSGLAGLGLAVLAQPLSSMLHLPQNALFGVGLFCIAYAVVIARMAARARLPEWSVWTVILGNLIWSIASLLLACSDWIAPSVAGLVFLLSQAALVFGFAELQYQGLRQSRQQDEWRQAPA